jgi:hypothetical protein
MNGWNRTFDSSTKSYEFSKITDHIGKKLFQSSRTYAVNWQFLAENQSKFCLPASLIDPILKNKACYSILPKGIELLPRKSMYRLYC